jgi:hypothetical protein
MNRPYTLPPDVQRLIDEPLSKPPARARGHWKPLDKAMGRLDDLTAQQASYDAEAAHLRDELGLAKRRDEQALGDALANGRDEPDPEAPAIEAEIERNADRSSAMTGQILAARRAVADLVLRNRDKWADDLQRHLADAQAIYRSAIVALERARAALEEEVRVGGWLSPFPETAGQPPTALMPDKQLVDPFTGRPEQVVVPQRPFTEVLSDLRRDADELPQRGPVRLSDMGLRRLGRKQLIVQSADAEGNARPQVLSGDTPAGWGAKDLLERVRNRG